MPLVGEDMGVSRYVDAIVSSVDVGFRKPHRAVFEAANQASECAPGSCVFIGNSERNDVEPAIALGMRVILVAVEVAPPVASSAHAIAASLKEAEAVLRGWLGSSR